ncbi:MAG: peptidoglycan DD-metalloendopeptidase family protein [bacterium]
MKIHCKLQFLLSTFLIMACGSNHGRFLHSPFRNNQASSMELAQTQDSAAEKDYRPAYLSLAKADLKSKESSKYPWPVELKSIGHNTASYQNYGGDPYFHHGLDIRADAGTDVLASVGGQVVNISNYGPGPAYWEVAILDDAGFLWQYHHVDRDSIPQTVWDAYRNKGRITSGTKIGEVYYWMVNTYGEQYHHIHLNVLARGGAYRNPFSFLQPLNDTKAPDILEVGLLRNGYAQDPSLPIQGAYSVYATIHDLILHDKFVVPPHKITYQLDDDPRERLVWEFSDLPGATSNTDYVEDFFVPSLTCGNYECRKLTVDLGFSTEGQRWFTNVGGQHTIMIHAEDQAGNRTSREFTWQVRHSPAP